MALCISKILPAVRCVNGQPVFFAASRQNIGSHNRNPRREAYAASRQNIGSHNQDPRREAYAASRQNIGSHNQDLKREAYAASRQNVGSHNRNPKCEAYAASRQNIGSPCIYAIKTIICIKFSKPMCTSTQTSLHLNISPGRKDTELFLTADPK
jgi:hypothetical protein